MLLEINEERELIGIEFLAPELVTPESVNRALDEHGFDPIDSIHLGPLRGSSEESTNTGHLLTATFVRGRLWAGYLYLTKRRDKSAGSRRVSDEMIVDVSREGDLIGIEFLAPVSYVDVHLLLMENGLEPLPRSELKPILID